jgi:sugar phosphate permease
LSLRGLWRGQIEALRLLSRNRILRYLVLLDVAVARGVIGPDIASLVYLTDTLQLGGREYGLLRGTVSFSMALGVFVLGRYASKLSRGHMLIGGIILVGLTYALAGTGPSAALLFGLWFVSGLGWSASWLASDSLYAEVTPDATRGRVYSLVAASYALIEAGTATFTGWMVTQFGPGTGLYVIGGAVSVGAIVVAVLTGGHRAIARFTPNADGAR